MIITLFRCREALVDGAFVRDVLVEVAGGRIRSLSLDELGNSEGQGGETKRADRSATQLTTVVPGFVNAHSHAFHRLLRGRTHADGGDFWRWRDRMYEAAGALTPETYEVLATDVFREMRAAGYTAVSEFHYVHHRPDGEPYPHHDMEIALARAARAAGIRLLLLDTCYLTGGVGAPLSPEQRRFGDGSAGAWLDRWHRLRAALAAFADAPDAPGTTLGAALHSVRAVAPDDLALVAAELPADVPLHVHLSEQAAENEACLAAHGVTPTGLLDRHGLVTPRLSAVHATHLADADIAVLGARGATIVMCPTTEADLGDGIGPAPELRAAGARLAIGSDQHAVIDPWEEIARLELDQRLRLQRRGIFAPAELWAAGAGRWDGTPGFRIGDPFDAVEVDTASTRTSGADPLQLPLVARAADVRATIVGGAARRSEP